MSSPINGLGSNSPVHKLTQQPIRKEIPADAPPQPTPARGPSADKLDLSGVSHLLKTLKDNDVRVDKVAQIKAQIEAGTYITDAKEDVAIDRLLDELER
jgi:anti-sigma28 factor (negative regulator of flagellin synthesis)